MPIPRPGPARPVLAVAAVSALVLGPAAPAASLPAEPAVYSVRGQYTGVAEHGHAVTMRGETYTTTSTFNVDLEGDQLLTAYCIDFRTGIVGDAWYREDRWDTYPGRGDFAEPGKVRWILLNSYPVTGLGELREDTGIAGVDASEALTATQAAIWHFSNGLDLEEVHQGPELEAGVVEGDVVRLYDHLVEHAEEPPDEPGSALPVSPDRGSGLAGGTVGEFTVETSAEEVPVTVDAPEGVELVDLGSGEPVTGVGDGSTVGFAVPADAGAGEATFTLEAEATVRTGRLFKGESDEPTQTLITAQGGQTTVTASASATWEEGGETTPPTDEPSEPTEEPSEPESPAPTPSPSETPSETPSAPADDSNEPTLPVTGGALAGLVAAGIAALGAGGGAIYLSRKRKAANAADLEG
ncbi:thioester domain-containing protein [Nocardiopsis tropica]|nr:thioester domain-containing protein [Nocardiopsis tropica]